MTGRILAWIRNSGSDGFAAMFPAIKFQEAVTAEGNIFVDLHFSVSKSVTAEIARSVALVKDAVVVKGF